MKVFLHNRLACLAFFLYSGIIKMLTNIKENEEDNLYGT